MKHTQFVIGCVLITAGIAWPSMTIVYGLKHFAEVYRTAAQQHRNIGVAQRSSVVAAVESGVSSIIGGVVVSLMGVTVALGRPIQGELSDA